jgi:PAS domain S-box-containing protein
MGPTLRPQTTPSSAKFFVSDSVWFAVQKLYPRALLLFLGVLSHVLTCYAGGQQPGVKNVLVLFSGIHTDNQFMDLIEPVIRARAPTPTTFYDAYLVSESDEQKRNRSWQSEAETLRSTYSGVKLDLVIAVSSPAIDFAMQYRDKLFSGVPIVITQVDQREIEGRIWPGVTGLTIWMGIGETLDLALRLQPDTKAVALVSSPGSTWLAITHSELLRRANKVREIDFVEPPSHNLLEKLAALPPHTIVLFQLPPDSGRSDFGALDVLDRVAQQFPTYSAWPSLCLNHGCIGGAWGSTKQITTTGEIVARVLSGERPEDIPIVNSPIHAAVDWRELRRWHIPESGLPPDTEVLYREPTLWERYRKYIVAAVALIAVQFLLIAGLLWQRARRRKAQAVLLESEKRFRVMADSTPALVWTCDERGKIAYLNERRLSFTGAHRSVGYGDAWMAYVHPDDLKTVLDTLAAALKSRQPFSQQYRLRRKDGVYRWMFDVASPRVDGDGSFAGFIGSAVDVTDQRMAQEALEKVSGQLIEAQEKERSRLARELHDDFSQRLALLSIGLGQLWKTLPKSDAKDRAKVQEMLKGTRELASDLHALSHQLHSSRLEHVGVVSALGGLCKEFSEKHKIEIQFSERDLRVNMPKEVDLCLFRVAQEALNNIVKHSQANSAHVEISANPSGVRLRIRDDGRGFDSDGVNSDAGIGLTGMRERMRLVGGSLLVRSEPTRGTEILAQVPLP